MPSTFLRSLFVVLAITLSLNFTDVQAMYARMSDTQLIQASDLIVLGTLTGFAKKPDPDGSGQRLVGILKVEKVLKGGKAAATVWLDVPQPGGLQSSSDTAFSRGQSGLWFLRRLPITGHAVYAADHPQRFVPHLQAEETARTVSDALD
jgi:hypothetical protein